MCFTPQKLFGPQPPYSKNQQTYTRLSLTADSLLGSGSDEEEEEESRSANTSGSPAHAPHPALHSELSHNGDTKPHDDSEDQVGGSFIITFSYNDQ